MAYENAKRLSPTVWRVTVVCGDYNSWVDAVVTAQGIEIDSQLIPWNELADARQFFTMRKRAESGEFPAPAAEQGEKE